MSSHTQSLSHDSGVSFSTVDGKVKLVDHYAVMGLELWATSEEIKHAHRRLREDYFRTDPLKYRALMEAYIVLLDKEARWKYDTMYRNEKGLPPPPPLSNVNLLTKAIAAVKDKAPAPVQAQVEKMRNIFEANLSMKEQLHVPPLKKSNCLSPMQTNLTAEAEDNRTNRTKMGSLSPIETKHPAESQDKQTKLKSVSETQKQLPMEKAMETDGDRTMSEASTVVDDENYALKNFTLFQLQNAMLGQRPYWSYIPILKVYDGMERHPELQCARPNYMLTAACNAMPY